jgi:poly-gamma-glutamate synthesis protein (capsule biosynthesis protein)
MVQSVFAVCCIAVSMFFLYGHLRAQSADIILRSDDVATVRATYHAKKDMKRRVADIENTITSTQKQSDITFLFGGDMIFDRYIRQISEKRGYDFIFAKMHDTLVSYDRVIANLEGPITSQPSVSVGSEFGSAKNYVFTFDPKVTQVLRDNNIRTVNLGNNHILNFGESGLSETRQFLSQSGIDFFGDPKDDSHRVAVENVKGIKVAFVNYNQFINGGDDVNVMADIREAKKLADIVVVYTHWGTEYVAPPQKVKDLAHKMIDTGADVIIGSHPHIVQESETYKGKKIYYSLGNFVFDQFFRDDTKKGLMVEMTIHPRNKNLSFEDKPITLDASGQIKLGQ